MNKTAKRAAGALLAALTILLCAGCGAKNAVEPASAPQTQTEAPAESDPQPEEPRECAVRADYLDDVKEQLGAYDDVSDVVALDNQAKEWAVTLAFRAEEDVADFCLFALELRDMDESGRALFTAAETYAAPALKADVPLAAPLYFPGDILSNGFSYAEADGTARYFALSISGKDGSLVVTPLEAAPSEAGELLLVG